MMKVILYFEI